VSGTPDLDHRKICLQISVAQTAAPTDIASEVVRSVAQVVVTKAQKAGWELIRLKAMDAAHCGKGDSHFQSTCQVLSSLSIKDLVASPEVLLNAAVRDLLAHTSERTAKEIKVIAPLLAAALSEASARWPNSRAQGIAATMRKLLKDEVLNLAAADCQSAVGTTKKFAWLAGSCMIESPDKPGKCQAVQSKIVSCTSDSAQGDDLRRLWDLAVVAFDPKAKPIDALNLGFALMDVQVKAIENKEQREKAQLILAATRDMMSGLVQNDWVQATSGAVRLVDALPEGTTEDTKKLLGLLAAVGNYALTFDEQNQKDPAASAAAREKIISELVDRMVNRTDRQSGAVISLGGSLGVFGGPRFAKPDDWAYQIAYPVQLTLGLGLQTYNESTGGFHGMLSAIDIGQYVNMNDSAGSLKVNPPELESSLAMGLTAGYWFALRETPVFVAGHGSVAPFNRVDTKPTYQAGVVLGLYVPLLDFN
jgi:hypothetical protein